jgi:hypothetical protein
MVLFLAVMVFFLAVMVFFLAVMVLFLAVMVFFLAVMVFFLAVMVLFLAVGVLRPRRNRSSFYGKVTRCTLSRLPMKSWPENWPTEWTACWQNSIPLPELPCPQPEAGAREKLTSVTSRLLACWPASRGYGGRHRPFSALDLLAGSPNSHLGVGHAGTREELAPTEAVARAFGHYMYCTYVLQWLLFLFCGQAASFIFSHVFTPRYIKGTYSPTKSKVG